MNGMTMPDTLTPVAEVPQQSLIVRTAQRYGIDAGKLMTTLKATAFKTDKGVTNEQMMALLIVAERHKLDPFTKQIYAYPDKWGGIVPVVGIDGWLHIVNTHPMFDGMHFEWDNAEQSMTCTLWRKDRSHPIVVTEYLVECRRSTEPWKMVHRMMRHKALMQCARYAFGFSGIYDEEEADDIVRGVVPRTVNVPTKGATNAERISEALESGEIIEATSPAPTPEHSHADPEPPTFAEYLRQMREASDAWVGEMVIEEAREYLSDDEVGELAHEFTRKFPPDSEGAPNDE